MIKNYRHKEILGCLLFASPALPTKMFETMHDYMVSQQSTHTPVVTLSSCSSLLDFLRRNSVLHSLLRLNHHPVNNNYLVIISVKQNQNKAAVNIFVSLAEKNL